MMKNNLEEATMKALQGDFVENEYTNDTTKDNNKQSIIANRENLQQTLIELLTTKNFNTL